MNKLKNWRIDRGLSQHELAAASTVARWRIQLIEQGIQCATPEETQMLAEALGVTVTKLTTAGRSGK